MSQDYVLNQKCPACGTSHQSTLNAIKQQRLFECRCCGLVINLRRPVEADAKPKQAPKEEEALAL